ncbi:DAK2 domain-containing protein [Inediibacterium massiliense]|uniref:DAK2 domain-containing protein n=1 Tax=Inediibacterium massiliense TaxID=1658111 RepID=UPI000AA5312E|nr:DAK2 domain-containing protein [Inediibacterium massiliense]
MKVQIIDGVLLKKMFIQGANILEENKEEVDGLNVFPVPDGDTGTNMSLTMRSAAKEIKELENNNVKDIAESMANGSLMGARGNSGVILSQLFRGFAKECENKEELTVVDLANAIKSASETAYKAVMKPIEGTILTVAREMGEKAIHIAKETKDIDIFLKSVIEYGEYTLSQTPNMLKVLKEAGVVDAGGKGLIFIYKGFYEAITGKEVKIEPIKISNPVQTENRGMQNIEFGYCTEFIIKGKQVDIDMFKNKIGKFGDCMLVVGDGNLVKVHIHTNHPGIIIESGLELGELMNLKIDNMRLQHENKIFDQVDEKEEIKEVGMITVTMGEGLTNIFKDLNVDRVITGGQTMNPSTEDIKKAIDEVRAKHIFIFPNNSNIILAANQAKQLSEKQITVIPTKTVPQGIASILAYHEDLDIKENEKNMIQALQNVKTGQITYSVRDTKFNDLDIYKDDILGMMDGEIIGVGKDIEEEAYKLLKYMIQEDDEIVTIFYGKDEDEDCAHELAQKIQEEYEDIDVEVYSGGQPLYYYIFSIE